MEEIKIPKFNEGDIVNLLPYDTFEEHIAIPETCWNKRVEQNPNKISLVFGNQHHSKRNGEIVNDIYYGLGDGYSFCEEFLEFHRVEIVLPEDLFDI